MKWNLIALSTLALTTSFSQIFNLMEKTNFTQMMRLVKGTVLAVVAVLGLGLNQAGAQSACYDDFTVPLGDSCMAEISVDMISNLTQGTYNSTGGYRVVIASTSANSSTAPVGEICSGDVNYMDGLNAPQIDTVYGEGTWMYGIYQWDDEKDCHQLYCWGTFTTEDKIDPRFVGDTTGVADVTATAQVDESVFNQYGTYKQVDYLVWDDNLGSSDPTFQPHLWSCYQSTNHLGDDFTWPNDSARTYDTIRITPSFTGYLTIIAASGLNSNENDDEANFDPVLAVYDEEFDSKNPCENMIAFGESSFIPNPLAGLGFANGLQNSSIAGAEQDSGDIFAPWLLHDDPVVRMDVKVAAGRDYIVVITHREYSNSQVAARVTNGQFEVYFMRNNYTDSDDISGNVTSILANANDSLLADTSYAYFDFTCADVDAVMLDNQKTYTNTRYTGGELNRMAEAMGTAQDRFAVGKAWRNQATALLSYHGRDTALLDLNELDLSRGSHAAAKKFMDSLLVDYGYMPMVIENCNPWEVKITDEYETFGDCGIDMAGYGAQAEGLNVSGIITRTFVVSDAGTKTDKDTAHIQLIFRNPNLYDVRLPHYTVNLECDEVAGGITSTAPTSTGYPFVATLTGFVDLTPDNAVCNLAASYEDVARVETCSETFKFRREWTVYDWCRPGTTIIYNQLIKVGDWTAPVLDTEGDATATQNPAGCDGTITVTAPVYTDNCGTVSYTAKVYFGEPSINNEVTGGYFSIGAGSVGVEEQGTYYVVWTATDACGNKGINDTTSVVLRDNIVPSCVIDDLRTITLTNYGSEVSEGKAYVTTNRLDEGSWDNCTPEADLVKHVRRMEPAGMTEWGDYVFFTCEDVGTEVLVELRVRDTQNNETICWTYIKPVDKTQPTCVNVPPVAYTCSDIPVEEMDSASTWDPYFNDSITALKVVNDSLCSIELQNLETEVFIDQCGIGYVNRYYTVYNQYYRELDPINNRADTCYMQIYFYEDHDYTITFPKDETINCDALDGNDLVISKHACDLITVSIDHETFNADGEECYKVFKTYKVINWCEYVEGTLAESIDSYIGTDGNNWNGSALTLHINYTTDNGQFTTAIDYHNQFTKAGRGDNDRHSERDTIDVNGLNIGLDTKGWSKGVGFVTDGIKNAKDGITDTMDVGEGGYWTFTQVLKIMDDNQEGNIPQSV